MDDEWYPVDFWEPPKMGIECGCDSLSLRDGESPSLGQFSDVNPPCPCRMIFTVPMEKENPWKTITNHCKPLQTIINHYKPLQYSLQTW